MKGIGIFLGKNIYLRKTETEINTYILHLLILHGTVNAGTLEQDIMTKRLNILKQHEATRSIWQNKTNGRWCTKLGADKHLIMRKNRSDLDNAIIEFYLCGQQTKYTFATMFKEFCEYSSRYQTVSNKTITEYENEYNRYLKSTELANTPMEKITEIQLAKTLRFIVHKTKLTNKRYSNVKTVIRKTFTFARLEHELNCITVDGILNDTRFSPTEFKVITHDESLEVFTLKEIKMIKEYLHDSTNLEELAILLDIETGLRLGEICVLSKKDISYEKKQLHICHSEHKAKENGKYIFFVGLPKKNKIANIQLTPDALALLKRIETLSDSEYLFPDENDKTTWNRSYNIDKTIRRICKELNIPVRSLQKIRRFYASVLLQVHKLPVKTVQKQLRHSDEATTLKHYSYNILDENEITETFNNLAI